MTQSTARPPSSKRARCFGCRKSGAAVDDSRKAEISSRLNSSHHLHSRLHAVSSLCIVLLLFHNVLIAIPGHSPCPSFVPSPDVSPAPFQHSPSHHQRTTSKSTLPTHNVPSRTSPSSTICSPKHRRHPRYCYSTSTHRPSSSGVTRTLGSRRTSRHFYLRGRHLVRPGGTHWVRYNSCGGGVVVGPSFTMRATSISA